MSGRLPFVLALTIAMLGADLATAQTSSRGQAVSPGQSRARNRLPQQPSAGRPTGTPASGPRTEQERQAEGRAKRATTICKGC